MLPDIGTYLIVFVGALVLAVVGTPLARRLGLRLDAVDQPDASRKVHTVPTPRLGGVAIFLSTLIAALLLRGAFSELSSILVGASLVSLLGFWDDRFSLGAGLKLLGQFVAVALLILTDVTIKAFHSPVLDLAATVVWVVGITNAMNLLDNMDGLSAGIAAIASAHFAIMCAFSGQYLVGAISVAVMAACVGFLVYNWNPATIFMGDSGSLFLGFMLASLGIKLRFPQNVVFVTWMVPLLVLGVPIFDTTLVTLSRLRRGLNPLTTPGMDHTSHRLTYAGLSRREAVFLLYITAFVLGLVVAVALVGLWRLERAPFWSAAEHT
jgi:UDP-GlcNAc:undecaprenyl-phosphate GlcNAc-1-phosphate transferase